MKRFLILLSTIIMLIPSTITRAGDMGYVAKEENPLIEGMVEYIPSSEDISIKTVSTSLSALQYKDMTKGWTKYEVFYTRKYTPTFIFTSGDPVSPLTYSTAADTPYETFVVSKDRELTVDEFPDEDICLMTIYLYTETETEWDITIFLNKTKFFIFTENDLPATDEIGSSYRTNVLEMYAYGFKPYPDTKHVITEVTHPDTKAYTVVQIRKVTVLDILIKFWYFFALLAIFIGFMIVYSKTTGKKNAMEAAAKKRRQKRLKENEEVRAWLNEELAKMINTEPGFDEVYRTEYQQYIKLPKPVDEVSMISESPSTFFDSPISTSPVYEVPKAPEDSKDNTSVSSHKQDDDELPAWLRESQMYTDKSDAAEKTSENRDDLPVLPVEPLKQEKPKDEDDIPIWLKQSRMYSES